MIKLINKVKCSHYRDHNNESFLKPKEGFGDAVHSSLWAHQLGVLNCVNIKYIDATMGHVSIPV